MSLKSLIADARKIVKLTPKADVINDFPQLTNAVVQKELSDEVKKLSAMARLPDEQAKKTQFTLLCQARDQQNQETFLHFAAHPHSHCNELYFNIAKELYPNANFQALFQLLVPGITTQLSIDLTVATTMVNERQKKTEHITLTKKSLSDPDIILALLPVQIDTFEHLLLIEQNILVLNEIERFNFKLHSELYQLLTEQNQRPLQQAIAAHNESLAELYTTLERLNGEGATLRDVILPMAKRMSVSGTASGTGDFASERGSQIAQRLLAYYANLPPEIQARLNSCVVREGSGNSFARVIRDIKAEECIETTSENILNILANPDNNHILDSRPFISEKDKTDLLERYQKKIGVSVISTRGALITTSLPPLLTQPFYQKMRIDSLETLITYLLSFPPEQYASFLSGASINAHLNYQEILPLLNETQRQALVDSVRQAILTRLELTPLSERSAMISGLSRHSLDLLCCAVVIRPALLQTILNLIPEDSRTTVLYRLGLGELIQGFLEKNEYQTIQSMLESIPSKDRGDILTIKVGQYDFETLLHKAEGIPKLLQALLISLSEPDRIKALKHKNQHSGSALYLITHNPDYLDSLRLVFSLLTKAQLQAEVEDILSRVAANNPEGLKMLLSLYPEEMHLTKIKEHFVLNEPLVPESLRVVLSLYPESERCEAIMNVHKHNYNYKLTSLDSAHVILGLVSEQQHRLIADMRDRQGTRYLFTIARHIEILQKLLPLYTDIELLDILKETELNLLYKAYYGSSKELLPEILRRLPADERLPALMRSCEKSFKSSVLSIINDLQSLQLIFSLLPDGACLQALQEVGSVYIRRHTHEEIIPFLDQLLTRLTSEECALLIKDEKTLTKFPNELAADFVARLQEKSATPRQSRGQSPHAFFADEPQHPQASADLENPPDKDDLSRGGKQPLINESPSKK